ncbi:MAG: hypothetical protein A2020_08230 [Lentisphaerae bacterium GWF2_45_14]|nr:MAG: hypothetical protein A2020_08230 [Lentisphaerae bacterium GWF2_45_14]
MVFKKEEIFKFSEERKHWLEASGEELTSQCRFDAFKSTGKGGQKRNKTSSALRLIHSPSGISVTADGSRSQNENRSEALRKLRYMIALEYRSAVPVDVPFENIEMSLSNKHYHLWTACMLDVFYDADFVLKDAAEKCGVSPSKLVKLIYRDTALWQELNRVMTAQGKSPLRAPA